MTTYAWTFPQFDVAKSEDGLTDVVKTIHCAMTGWMATIPLVLMALSVLVRPIQLTSFRLPISPKRGQLLPCRSCSTFRRWMLLWKRRLLS